MNIEHKLRDIRSDWESRGFGFEDRIDPPGQVWRDFVHDVDELVMLVEGEIELTFGGRTVRPGVGEEVSIQPAHATPCAIREKCRTGGVSATA